MAEKPTPPPPFRSALQAYAWVFAAIGLLLLLGSSVVYLLNSVWRVQAQIGIGLGLLLILVAVLLRPDVVRAAFTGRQVKYASNAIIKSIAFIGILGLINFLVVKYAWEYDLTETGQFTLSEQTMQILQNLNRPVTVIGFFQNGDPRLDTAKDYLERYSHHTDFLTYEFHDPDLEPALAQQYDLNNYGLVFASNNKHTEIPNVDEQSITTGLLRVSNDTEEKIYFITGHGEHSIDDSTEEGYSTARQALEREGHTVETINLATAETIPSDAMVLVLAGADRPLLDTETKLLEDWLAAGGKLMVLVDPLEPAPLAATLQNYGVSLDDNYVVEDPGYALLVLGPDGRPVPQVIAPLIYQYPFHEITRSLNGYQSFFPFARSVTVSQLDDFNKGVWPLLTTSPGSWAETDLEAAQPKYTPDTDPAGPLNLGVAIEDADNGDRLVIFGNAGFVTNQNYSSEWANMDLFVNAVDWLAEAEDLISIRPQQPTDRTLFLNSVQTGVTVFTTLIVIPLAVLLAGVGVWWKRR